MKTCNKCGETKPYSAYTKHKGCKDGYNTYCRSCCNEQIKNRRQKSDWIEHRRDWEFKRRYGISLEEYDILREQQNYRCCICNKHEKEVFRARLYVDHCHINGKVRGLLCSTCNKAIGLLKDSEEFLLNAVNYLRSNTNG